MLHTNDRDSEEQEDKETEDHNGTGTDRSSSNVSNAAFLESVTLGSKISEVLGL